MRQSPLGGRRAALTDFALPTLASRRPPSKSLGHFPTLRKFLTISQVTITTRLWTDFHGFNTIPIRVEDQHYTTFLTPFGMYCYTVMPFSLKNAPHTYCHYAMTMFRPLLGKCMQTYMDDVAVYINDFDDLLRHLGGDLTTDCGWHDEDSPREGPFLLHECRFHRASSE